MGLLAVPNPVADLHPLVAEIQTAVMARSFVVALALVAPVAAVWLRRSRAGRAATAAVEPPLAVPTETPTLESVLAGIDARARDAAAGAAGSSVVITVPHRLTADGVELLPSVVDPIVRDALARAGLVPTAELDTGDARVIECRSRRSP